MGNAPTARWGFNKPMNGPICKEEQENEQEKGFVAQQIFEGIYGKDVKQLFH
jgi:hypothetical protein